MSRPFAETPNWWLDCSDAYGDEPADPEMDRLEAELATQPDGITLEAWGDQNAG